MLIKAGQPAPDFELETSEGEPFQLSDLQGLARVMLIFYPKDRTSG
jgi:thioredoxin-dependent peroxiredoxin